MCQITRSEFSRKEGDLTELRRIPLKKCATLRELKQWVFKELESGAENKEIQTRVEVSCMKGIEEELHSVAFSIKALSY